MRTLVVLLAALLVQTPTGTQSQSHTPNLKGPAPRLPNGKPSMAGVWDNTRRADVTDPPDPRVCEGPALHGLGEEQVGQLRHVHADQR